MRKLFSVFTVLILVFLVGCSSSGENGKEADVKEILDGMVEKISLDLREMGYTDADFEEETLPGYLVIDLLDEEQQDYNPYTGIIDFAKIEAAFTIRAGWDLSADRIIVFKVTDSNYLSEVKELLEAENAAQYELWEQYIQEQFQKVKDTIIETEGNLIYYITYKDAEGIEEVILDAVN